jgi:serine/threonine protein kinase
VIDFGIARAVEGTAVTRTGMRVGSPHYMAPEQIAGRSISTVINQITGQPTEFIGQGPTATYRANGTGKTDYGKRTVFRATVNGNKWTYVISGYITWHWRIKDGKETDSHPREHGTLALFDNGVYNNGGPLRLAAGPGRYTCSGSTLQSFSNTGSATLTRVQPKPQQGS